MKSNLLTLFTFDRHFCCVTNAPADSIDRYAHSFLLARDIQIFLMYVQGKLGVLELSLCYQPASETITIVIIKARDLKAKDINGLSGNTRLTQTLVTEG